RIIAVCADRLGVPGRGVEQNHSPALDRVVPDDTGISADTLVLALPFEHQAPPCPARRNRESSVRCLARSRLLGDVLRPGCAHSQDSRCAKNAKNEQRQCHAISVQAHAERSKAEPRPRAPGCECNNDIQFSWLNPKFKGPRRLAPARCCCSARVSSSKKASHKPTVARQRHRWAVRRGVRENLVPP